jgi:hypothetical protein
MEVCGQDTSNQWAQPSGGQFHQRASPYNGEKNMGGLEWELELGGYGSSPPVIGSGGSIYVSSRGEGSGADSLYCFNQDGDIQWKEIFDVSSMKGPVLDNQGNIVLAYSETEGNSYLVRYDQNGNQLLQREIDGSAIEYPIIDQEDHIFLVIRRLIEERYDSYSQNYLCKYTTGFIPIWEYELPYSQDDYTLPAIAPDGSLYFNSYSFTALDEDGERIWSNHSLGSLYPPLYHKNRIYLTTLFHLACLDLSGEMQWLYTPEHGIMGSPLSLSSDDCIVFFDDDYYIYKVDLNGDLVWEQNTQSGSLTDPLCSADGFIFAHDHSNVFKFDEQGRRMWDSTYLSASGMIGPDHGEGIALSSDGSIYYTDGPEMGKFKGIDFSTPITIAWFFLIFITLTAAIGAFVLYQKRSIRVLRKGPLSPPRAQSPLPQYSFSELQCPNCSRVFSPISNERISCPYCGMTGDIDTN